MSTGHREPMGVKHLTVVPKNFEPGADGDGDRDATPDDAAPDDGGDRSDAA